jgi:hypothetical protein
MKKTRQEMIARVSEMAEEADLETVGYYLDNAAEILLNNLYPFDEAWETEEPLTVPNRYLNLQMRMAVVLLNKRGADGETMHIENGINRHYGAADIPSDMLCEIVPKAVAF